MTSRILFRRIFRVWLLLLLLYTAAVLILVMLLQHGLMQRESYAILRAVDAVQSAGWGGAAADDPSVLKHSPMLLILILGVMKLGFRAETAGQIIVFGFTLAFAMGLYCCMWRLYRRPVYAVASSFLVLTLPMIYQTGSCILPEPPLWALMIWTLYLTMRVSVPRFSVWKKLATAAVCGILCGMTLMLWPEAQIFLASIGLWWIAGALFSRKKGCPVLHRIIFAAAAVVLFFGMAALTTIVPRLCCAAWTPPGHLNAFLWQRIPMTEWLALTFDAMDGSFFYVLPVFILMSLSGRYHFRTESPEFHCFQTTALLLFGGYLVLAAPTRGSLSMMTPALLMSCFAGGGLAAASGILLNLTKRNGILRDRLVIAAVIAIMAGMPFKFLHSSQKTFLLDFAAVIDAAPHSAGEKADIIGVDTGDAAVLSDLVKSFRPGYSVRASWADVFMQEIIPNLSEPRTLYFLISLPAQTGGGEFERFRNLFRSCYYVFPFDIAADAEFRSVHFYLLKFNHRTGDGIVNTARGDAFAYLPDPLLVKSDRRVEVDLARYLPPGMPMAEDDYILGFTDRYTPSMNFHWLCRMIDGDSLPESCLFVYYNSFFWPQASARVNLAAGIENSPAPASRIRPAPPEWSVLPSDQPPLFLNPPEVFSPYQNRRFHLSGGDPVSGNKDRMRYAFEVREDGRLGIRMRDTQLGRESSSAVFHRMSDPEILKEMRLHVLIVTCQKSEPFLLKNELQTFLPKSVLKTIPLDEFLARPFPASSFDAILLDCFEDDVFEAGEWAFRPEEYRKQTDEIVSRAKALGRHAAVLLPPAPAKGACLAPIGRHSRPNQMGHYWICERLIEFYGAEDSDVSLVPLFFAVDPKTGYARTESDPNILLESYYLNDSGRRAIGEAAAAWLAWKLDSRQSED